MLHHELGSSDRRAITTASRNILVLGGTAFVGRALVEATLRQGHRVTLFNRGITNPDLFPEAEKLRGDRASDLSVLADRTWDAVVDVAAYDPADVERSVEVLCGHVSRYVFVSTLSVYANHGTTDAQLENAPTLDLNSATDTDDLYGARKAACERIVLRAFDGRASVARVGLIVGPHDPTNRFAYWPRRMAAGGRVLAPGSPEDALQFIDVRDLAQWLLRAAVADVSGVFNVTGRSISFEHLLDACRVPGVDAETVWIPSARLLDAGLDPWMGVPLWIGAAGWEAANAVDVSRATRAGLAFRPLLHTITDARLDAGDREPLLSASSERTLLRHFA
jgi:2'-hydroxyisoflavone reductase